MIQKILEMIAKFTGKQEQISAEEMRRRKMRTEYAAKPVFRETTLYW